MKDLFITFLEMLDGRGNITEATMYAGGEFSKIVFEAETGTYTISIIKEKETDGNL